MARRKELNWKQFSLKQTVKEEFIRAIDPTFKEDRFAKTFVAKANMLNLWGNCLSVYNGSEVCGAIAWTISVRKPKCANLQLLHTFHRYRRLGIGAALCNEFLRTVFNHVEYFRVSAEVPAIPFYRSIGVTFQGVQKSKCFVAIGKLSEIPKFENCNYSIEDNYIKQKLLRKGKGGCIELFEPIKNPP